MSTTVLLLPEFYADLVEDDAVVFSFNDHQAIVRTPRPRTLLVWALPDSHWMQISRYHEMLSRYFDAFPRSQIHVFLFDDLKLDLQGVIRDM